MRKFSLSEKKSTFISWLEKNKEDSPDTRLNWPLRKRLLLRFSIVQKVNILSLIAVVGLLHIYPIRMFIVQSFTTEQKSP